MTVAQRVVATTWLANGFQAAAAYREAHPGCSDRTAQVEGSRTLSLPAVRAFIRACLDEWLGPLEMSAEEAVRRIGAMARADVRVLHEKAGKLLPVMLTASTHYRTKTA
jgi:phage terminase small subunit